VLFRVVLGVCRPPLSEASRAADGRGDPVPQKATGLVGSETRHADGRRSGDRPSVSVGTPIQDYSLEELVSVSDASARNTPIHFECSDGTWHMVA